MHSEKRITTNMLLLFLICLSLSLRMPGEWSSGSSAGSDAMSYHWMTRLLIEYGEMVWIMDITSYFGMYPFSTPSGSEALIGTISLVFGLSIDYSILLFNFVSGALASVLAFLIGKLLFRKNIISFFVALTLTLNKYFFINSLWRFSTRGFFICFSLVLVLCLLRTLMASGNKTKFFNLFILSYFLLFTTHRMVAYLVPTLFLPLLLHYIFLRRLPYIISSYGIKYSLNQMKWAYVSLLVPILTVALSIILFPDLYIDAGLPIQEKWISSKGIGESVINFEESVMSFSIFGRLLQVGRSHTEMGLLAFLSIVGFFFLFLKKYKTGMDGIFISIFSIQMFFLLDVEYFAPILLLSLSIMSGYGFIFLSHNLVSGKTKHYVVIALILLPCSYAFFVKDLNTRVKGERIAEANPDFDAVYGLNQEMWSAGFWREEYIGDKMFLKSSPFAIRLLLSDKGMMTEDQLIVWLHKDIRERLVVDRYSTMDIVLNQRGYHYGGVVEDWLFLNPEISGDKHEELMLGVTEISEYDKDRLREYYEVTFVVHVSIKFDAIHYDYPFFDVVFENNYPVYRNEAYTFLFYKEW